MSETSDGETGRRPQGRVGTVINGKWTVDARIGSGGMATVYAATHRNGHRAALKMLHTTLSRDADTRARFLREGYVANAVGHPGVVTVLDDDIAEDGAAYLVLELLEGETVEARRVRLGGKLPIDEALDIADQALDALAAAHAKGIVHRDVKPDNVFLTTRGEVKLLDFGLARMRDATAEATRTGVTIGTPEFMPPEQAIGKRGQVDARSDVWGLGATLFTIITGEYVHDARTLHDQLLASATRRARPIRPLAPHVPPAVALVIDRALELEKHERWPSAHEMQHAFRAARPERRRGFEADSLTVPVSSRPGVSSSDPTMAMGGPVASPASEPTALQEGRFETTEPLPPSPRTAVMAAKPTSPGAELDLLPSSAGPPPRTQRLSRAGYPGAPPIPAATPGDGVPALASVTPGGGIPSLPAFTPSGGGAREAAAHAGQASAELPQGFGQTVAMAPIPPGPRTPRTGASYAGGAPSAQPPRSAGPSQEPPSRGAAAPPLGPGALPPSHHLPSPPPRRSPAVWRLVAVALAVAVVGAAWLLFRGAALHAP